MIVALIYRMKHPPVPENTSIPTSMEVPDPPTSPEPSNAPAPIETKSFPEILKSHRTARHMSQEYIAEQLGVTRQAVSKWESGTSEPSTANLLALAKLYGISLDELVGLK
ncbi:MAG: helix-turn-helix domain-containing protein [Clostridia bacterium]|nr:helix-turn-helix domain-containing protein [Clostridia bacterium]